MQTLDSNQLITLATDIIAGQAAKCSLGEVIYLHRAYADADGYLSLYIWARKFASEAHQLPGIGGAHCAFQNVTAEDCHARLVTACDAALAEVRANFDKINKR